MISNERPSPYGQRPQYASGSKPAFAEETIGTETLQIERKTFVFTLKENPRGRFLRITEEVGGRRDHVIVPSTGLEDFQKVLAGMARLAAETPPPGTG